MRDGYRVIAMLQDKVGHSFTSETVAEHTGLRISSASKVLAELARKRRLIELPQRLGHFKIYCIDSDPENADLDEYYARQQQGPKTKATAATHESIPMVSIEGRMFDRALAAKLIEFLNAWNSNPLAPPMTVQSIAKDTGLNRGFVGRFIRHLSDHGYITDANSIQTRPRVFGVTKPLPVPESVEVTKQAEPGNQQGGTNGTSPRVADAFARMAVCYERIDKRLLEMNARLDRLEQAWV